MQYRVTHNIKGDGGMFYYPGEIVEFTEEQAKPLLYAGAIEPVHKPFSQTHRNTAFGDHLEKK